jgi:signal transduction histidine kinase
LVPLDEGLSEQAFVNLIQNAYDAMGVAGGTLRVTAALTNGAHRKGVEVRIEDTGPGVAAELREQIFNPFVTTKKTGVGLGLSIVSRIIDGHHGTIRVESGGEGSGQGARFIVFFPVTGEVAENPL